MEDPRWREETPVWDPWWAGTTHPIPVWMGMDGMDGQPGQEKMEGRRQAKHGAAYCTSEGSGMRGHRQQTGHAIRHNVPLEVLLTVPSELGCNSIAQESRWREVA